MRLNFGSLGLNTSSGHLIQITSTAKKYIFTASGPRSYKEYPSLWCQVHLGGGYPSLKPQVPGLVRGGGYLVRTGVLPYPSLALQGQVMLQVACLLLFTAGGLSCLLKKICLWKVVLVVTVHSSTCMNKKGSFL